ncbi:MFS transporter [Pseudomonas sp. ABAC61]|nr:MFS transporter [Pseudomonas sp. ABAC61]
MGVFAQQQRKWWALLGVSIASFLGCVDFTIVNTALPALQADLGASVDSLQWVINGFILALSSFMVLVGRLADLHGRKRVLFIGLSVFGLASLAAGLAGQIDTLVAARVLQGLACAVLYTASGAIVSSTFDSAEQGRAFGVLFGVNGVGLAAGPVLGGLITSSFGWQWIFLINVPFVLLSLGFVQGAAWGWGSPPVLGLILLALLALGAFLVVERRVEAPIIDLTLFANRRFVGAVVASFSLAVFYCVAFFVMPLYLAQIRGASVQASGLLLLPTTLGVALLSPLVGRLVDRKGPALLIKTGLLLFVLSALLQAGFERQTSLPYLLGAFVIMGLGWASILGPSTVLGISSVPQEVGSVAMGSLMTLHNVGGGIGLAVGVGLFHQFSAAPASDVQAAFLNGYQVVMGFLALASLLAWASVSVLLRTVAAPAQAAREDASRG